MVFVSLVVMSSLAILILVILISLFVLSVYLNPVNLVDFYEESVFEFSLLFFYFIFQYFLWIIKFHLSEALLIFIHSSKFLFNNLAGSFYWSLFFPQFFLRQCSFRYMNSCPEWVFFTGISLPLSLILFKVICLIWYHTQLWDSTNCQLIAPLFLTIFRA